MLDTNKTLERRSSLFIEEVKCLFKEELKRLDIKQREELEKDLRNVVSVCCTESSEKSMQLYREIFSKYNIT